MDDDADCVEHAWRLVGVTTDDAGAHQDFECTRCPAVLVTTPGSAPG